MCRRKQGMEKSHSKSKVITKVWHDHCVSQTGSCYKNKASRWGWKFYLPSSVLVSLFSDLTIHYSTNNTTHRLHRLARHIHFPHNRPSVPGEQATLFSLLMIHTFHTYLWSLTVISKWILNNAMGKKKELKATKRCCCCYSLYIKSSLLSEC